MKVKNQTPMLTNIKLFMTIFLLVLSKLTIAQFTSVKYEFDSSDAKWNKTILFTLNTSDTSTLLIRPFKESLLDSFGIKKIEIFPNKTSDSLNLKINIISTIETPLLGSIKLLNLQGTTTYRNQTILPRNNLYFSLLANGYYLLRIELNGQLRTYKIFKN
jgi:hypothetical protein